MSPRTYQSRKRAESAEATRRRIVEATVSLHMERGVGGTSWQDIAERAGVAVGSVYYHFPTVDELVPACTAMGLAMYPPPTAEMFRGVRSRAKRVEMLVRETFRSYEPVRGVLGFSVVERKTIPAVGRIIDEMTAETRALVRAAIGDDASATTVRVVAGLLDFRVWESLIDQGLSKELIVELISASTLSHLKKSK